MKKTNSIKPRRRRHLAFAVLSAATISVNTANAAGNLWDHNPYQLGQGLRFPDQGLDIGGYLSLQFEDLKRQQAVLSVHDLSLFVNKHFGTRWNVFTEMEIGDTLKVTDDGGISHNPDFDIERLYADYRVNSAVTFRVGKFLTPVGRWNMIHADPLVWTVSRPLTTTAAFARHATGIMVYGSVPAAGNDLDYWVFADDTGQFDPLRRREPAFDVAGSTIDLSNNFYRALGGRVLYHFAQDHAGMGSSYLHFEMKDRRDEKNLYGVDFYWNTRLVNLSGEAVYRITSGSSRPDERGGFIQTVIPMSYHLYLVGRYEHYYAKVVNASSNINTLGITYRPRPPLSVKLEYRSGSNNVQIAPDGWLASLAVLF